MPHCRICDKNLDPVLISREDLKPRPCAECEEIIADTIFEMDDDYSLITKIESELNEYDEELKPSEIDLGDAEW